MNKITLFLYQPYKWLILIPLFAIWTIISGFISATISIFSDKKAFCIGVAWATLLRWIMPMPLKVSGRENIKKNTSYVVMCNHQSGIDILAVYCGIGLNFRWILKKELRKVPIIGWACDMGKHIFIDRTSARAAYRSLQKAKQILTDGTSVVIFPEGTRNYSNELTRFKSGGFKLANQLGLPILPVTILDTHKVMGRSFVSLRPAKVEVIIHEAINTEAYKENQEELMQKVKECIGTY